MPAVKTPVGAVAKTHRFDWRPREPLRPPVTHTYMMLSKFPHGGTDGQGDSRSRMVMLCWCLQGKVSWSSHAVDVVVVDVVDVVCFSEAFLILSDAIIFDRWTGLSSSLLGKSPAVTVVLS